MTNKKGFTLIELLVVIAIIGLLASIVLVAVNDVRKKARDTQRINTLKQLSTTLELYYDKYGSYPSTSNNWWGEGNPCYGNHTYSGANGWIPNLASEFITILPSDPKADLAAGRCYLYRSNGTDYTILAHQTMENICGGDPSAACNPLHIQQMDRVCCTQPTIAIYSPGARGW